MRIYYLNSYLVDSDTGMEDGTLGFYSTTNKAMQAAFLNWERRGRDLYRGENPPRVLFWKELENDNLVCTIDTSTIYAVLWRTLDANHRQ